MNQTVVNTIYLDFEKVPCARLQKKLKCYAIVGGTYHWIENYSNNRSQVVSVNGNESIVGLIFSGVPQGIVLGLLLFILYINDSLDVTLNRLLFADDIKVFRTITCKEDYLLIQEDMAILENWINNWQLSLNSKCHVLSLGKFENTKHTHRYKINDNVFFGSDLSFKEHISTKIKKAKSILELIRRSFSYLDSTSFVMLYSTFVRPHLEYVLCMIS